MIMMLDSSSSSPTGQSPSAPQGTKFLLLLPLLVELTPVVAAGGDVVFAGRRSRYWVIYIVDRRIKYLFWPRTISFATIYYIILFHYSNRSTRAIHDHGEQQWRR